MRPIAVTSPKRLGPLPDVPTLQESGFPTYEVDGWYGIAGPKGLPTGIIDKLNQEMVRILERADVKEKFFNTGVEAIGSTPEQLTAAVKSEMSLLGRLIRDLGIRDE